MCWLAHVPLLLTVVALLLVTAPRQLHVMVMCARVLLLSAVQLRVLGVCEGVAAATGGMGSRTLFELVMSGLLCFVCFALHASFGLVC